MTARTQPWPTLLTCLALGALAGATLDTRPMVSRNPTSSNQVPLAQLATCQDSFSELVNTKATLDILSAELAIDVHLAVRNLLKGPKGGPDAAAERREAAITTLEQGIAELQGTDRQPILTVELLPLLEEAGRLDAWIDSYLKVVYHHPTHSLIGRFAADALRIGRSADRLPEVVQALRIAESIPLPGTSKLAVRTALDSLLPTTTAWVNPRPSLDLPLPTGGLPTRPSPSS